jgi:hypothetical protein
MITIVYVLLGLLSLLFLPVIFSILGALIEVLWVLIVGMFMGIVVVVGFILELIEEFWKSSTKTKTTLASPLVLLVIVLLAYLTRPR